MQIKLISARIKLSSVQLSAFWQLNSTRSHARSSARPSAVQTQWCVVTVRAAQTVKRNSNSSICDHLGQIKKSESITQLASAEVAQLSQLVFLTWIERVVREAHVDLAS